MTVKFALLLIFLFTVGLVFRDGRWVEWSARGGGWILYCIFLSIGCLSCAWGFLLCRLGYWCATLISHFDRPPGIYLC